MNTLTETEKQEGWRLLFDGETLNGWRTLIEEGHGWAVEDGCIRTVKPRSGSYLYTPDQFEDFVLSVTWRIDPKVNSGIFFRWSDLKDPVNTGLEMQILDSYGTEDLNSHTCGAIYELVPPNAPAFLPAGEWNTAVITCKGPHISVVLNDQLVAEMDVTRWVRPGENPDGTKTKFLYAWNDLPRRGHIGLQNYGTNPGPVWFRDVKIKELKQDA